MAVTDELKEKIKKATTSKPSTAKAGASRAVSSLRTGVNAAANAVKSVPGKLVRGATAVAAPYAAIDELSMVPAYQAEAQYDTDVKGVENFLRQTPETLSVNLRNAQTGLDQYRAETERLKSSGEGGRWFAMGDKNLDRRADNLAARERSIRLMQMAAANQQPAPPATYGARGIVGTLMGDGGKQPPMIEGATVAVGNDTPTAAMPGDTADGAVNPNLSKPTIDPKTGELAMTTPDGRGSVSAANQTAFDNIRKQANDPAFLDRMIERSMQGGDEGRLQGISGAVRAAIARGEPVNIDRAFGRSGFGKWSDAQEADYQIDLLRKKLASPGRGLNQSASSYAQEQAEKRGIRQQINALSKRRDSLLEQEAAQNDRLYERFDKERAYQLDVAKEVNKLNEKRLAAGLEADDKATGVFKDYQDKMAGFEAEGDFKGAEAARRANINVAKDQYIRRSRTGQGSQTFFDSPEGQLAERETKKKLMTEVFSEAGLWDAIRSKFGFAASPSQQDLEKIDFKGWKIDKGEIVLPDWLVNNTAVRATGEGRRNLYAYASEIPAEYLYVMKELIKRDNPEQSVRGRQ